MLKKNVLRLLAMLLLTVMLFVTVACNTVYDIRTDDMDKPWEDGEPDEDGTDKNNGNNNNNNNNNSNNNNNNNNNNDNTDGTDDDGGEDITPLPDSLNFEGLALTVLYRDTIESSREWYKESPEDELDEAIAFRNMEVMDDLNIVVNYHPVPNAGYDTFAATFNGMIADDIISDIHYFDVAANFAYAGAYTTVRDCAANLLDKEAFPYFNFKDPAWNQSIINETSFGGRLHYVTGAANLSAIDSAMLLWHNCKLYELMRTETDPVDIVQFALDGHWTYEKMYNMVAAIDPESKGFLGLSGSVYGSSHPCDLLPVAWNVDLIIENEDGSHAVNIENNGKIKDVMDKYAALASLKGSEASRNPMYDFASGVSLFALGTFYESQSSDMMLREMEDPRVFLPWPKYDEKQENYYTTSRDYYTLMTVLDHAESTKKTQGEAVSAYLQFLMKRSAEIVVPLYKTQRVTKNCYYHDYDQAGEMYDLIVGSLKYDFRTVYSPQLNNITWLWRDNMNSPDRFMEKYLDKKDTFAAAVNDTDYWLGIIEAKG